MSGDERRARRANRRRVSVIRLTVVLAVIGASLAGTVWLARAAVETFETGEPVRFAPYVDVTLTPANHFEDPLENRAEEITLSFIVADLADPCQPSWGTYYGLDAAGRALDLDRRIARYRERGADVTVSFGGQANDELAVACADVGRLRISRLNPRRLSASIAACRVSMPYLRNWSAKSPPVRWSSGRPPSLKS